MIVLAAISSLAATATLHAQSSEATAKPAELKLSEFLPEPQLKVAHTDVQRAKFPVVDVHTHFWYRMRHDPEQLDEFVRLMDRNNIAMCVSLDGRLGDQLDEHIRALWGEYRERFLIFANLDWQGSGADDQPETWACNQSDFVHWTVIELEAAAKRGISGLKVFKSLGLSYRNADGSLIAIDDSRSSVFAPSGNHFHCGSFWQRWRRFAADRADA